MARHLDETYEEAEARERHETFYGSYSSSVRKNLMSKNIIRPESLYDVFYTRVRNDSLSKNKPIAIIDANKDQTIRDNMLSSNLPKKTDIENLSEGIRDGMVSKNKLIQTTLDIDSVSDRVRDNMLSKIVKIPSDIEKSANSYRDNQTGKNVSKHNDLEISSKQTRENMSSANVSKNTDLESSSNGYRSNSLSKNDVISVDIEKIGNKDVELAKNISKNINLEKSSSDFRENQTSKNVENNTDILTNSSKFLENQKSKNNDANSNNLDQNSTIFRQNALSQNDVKKTDLETNSSPILKDNLSKNVSENTDLSKISSSFRDDQIKSNVPKSTDVENGSSQFRENQIGSNKEKVTDLEKDSGQFREKQLSSNDDKITDLENVSKNFRDNNLSSNDDDKNSDLEKEDKKFRDNNLASNVPNNIDLVKVSETYKNNNLASNVPTDLSIDSTSKTEEEKEIAKNVPNNFDLETLNKTYRNDQLSKNDPRITDLEKLGNKNIELSKNAITPNILDLGTTNQNQLENQLSKNVSKNIDLESTSKVFLDQQMSFNNVNQTKDLADKNAGSKDAMLMKNMQITTDTDKLVQSGYYKKLSIAPNVEKTSDLLENSNPFRNAQLSKNIDTTVGTNIVAFGTSQYIGLSNLWLEGVAIRALTEIKDWAIFGLFGTNLQKYYSNSLRTNDVTTDTAKPYGRITNAIQQHNISQNVFTLNGYNDGTDIYKNTLQTHNNDGFQELLAGELPEGLKNRVQLQSNGQPGTNATPSDIVAKNDGLYLAGEPENILRPTISSPATSMASQTQPSDILVSDDFVYRQRGVAHIIDTIKTGNFAIAKNYDVQGQAGSTKSFVIGLGLDKNGAKTLKRAYSRWTIKNPYALSEAGALALKFKNYALEGNKNKPPLPSEMAFPPYVVSFQHGDTANWNSTLFLGRPEPVYTYGTGSRDGTITFFVLTDFAQSVDIGYDYANMDGSINDPATIKKWTEDFGGYNFTKDTRGTITKAIKPIQDEINSIEAQMEIKREEQKANTTQQNLLMKNYIRDYSDQDAILKNTFYYDKFIHEDMAKLQGESQNISVELNALGARWEQLTAELEKIKNGTCDYVENRFGNNSYKTIIDMDYENVSGYKESKAPDTKRILDLMKKDIMFQPAYFSGSKVDFITRMEFISKMTKPARNDENNGFSFIKPPICHMWLGTWFNYDIVVNSVTYSYDNVPWTIDNSGDNRVQPMWAQVTLQFNIIGGWGEPVSNADTPLATDNGGFYNERTYGAYDLKTVTIKPS